jgi:hypothetical protein
MPIGPPVRDRRIEVHDYEEAFPIALSSAEKPISLGDGLVQQRSIDEVEAEAKDYDIELMIEREQIRRTDPEIVVRRPLNSTVNRVLRRVNAMADDPWHTTFEFDQILSCATADLKNDVTRRHESCEFVDERSEPGG